jgi:hypothetical protein
MTPQDNSYDEWLQGQFDYVLKKATGKTFPGQRQRRVEEAKAAIISKCKEREAAAHDRAKQELRDKFHIDADKSYDVMASETAIVISVSKSAALSNSTESSGRRKDNSEEATNGQ